MPLTSLGASSAFALELKALKRKALKPKVFVSGPIKTANAAATATMNPDRIGMAPVQAIGSVPYPLSPRRARAGNGHSRRNRDKIMQTLVYLTSSVEEVLR
jgi:hypothetical protein